MDSKKLIALLLLMILVVAGVYFAMNGSVEDAEALRDEATGQRAIDQGESMQETLRQVGGTRQGMIDESGALDP